MIQGFRLNLTAATYQFKPCSYSISRDGCVSALSVLVVDPIPDASLKLECLFRVCCSGARVSAAKYCRVGLWSTSLPIE